MEKKGIGNGVEILRTKSRQGQLYPSVHNKRRFCNWLPITVIGIKLLKSTVLLLFFNSSRAAKTLKAMDNLEMQVRDGRSLVY